MRVRINFGGESIADIDQLLYNLSAREVGFAALYKIRKGFSLTLYASTRVALDKMKKICTKLEGVTEVVPFEMPEGELLKAFGELPVEVEGDVKDARRAQRGLAKDEELFVLGGKAYACREIPLPSNFRELI